jgi:hypothetical protein
MVEMEERLNFKRIIFFFTILIQFVPPEQVSFWFFTNTKCCRITQFQTTLKQASSVRNKRKHLAGKHAG